MLSDHNQWNQTEDSGSDSGSDKEGHSNVIEDQTPCDSEFEVLSSGIDNANEGGNEGNQKEATGVSDEDDNNENSESSEEENATEVWQSAIHPEDDFHEVTEANDVPLVQKVLIHLLLIWQNVFKVSDNGVAALLLIIKTFIHFFFTSRDTDLTDIPTTYSSAKKRINLTEKSQNYVCCKKCCTLYKYDECIESKRGDKRSKLCSRVSFPSHPQRRQRQPCNTPLMKGVCLSQTKSSFYPFKVYSYNPLKDALEVLFQRDEIVAAIKRGLKNSENNILHDINDGAVWKTFEDKEGNYYFDNKRNLAGILNVDWFEPFSNVQHSVGVIYIAILNLPREIRFKQENIIIVGVIPGPKEPENTINSFLLPLVDDLLEFWDGRHILEKGVLTFYRFALLCVSSDLPATRKCCGFLSYNAYHGMDDTFSFNDYFLRT